MRIYCPELPREGEVTLSVEETEHAVKVFRLKKGDQCELFDGKGNGATATLVAVQKKNAVVGVVQYVQSTEVKSTQIVVGIGLPRGDRQRNVFERATELGVDILVPLNCEFGVAVATDNSIERARRTVIESCKQSGRNRLMEISCPQDYSHWIKEDSTDRYPCLRLICHPRLEDAISLRDVVKLHQQYLKDQPKKIMLAIGPEGGFSDAELQIAIAHGWKALDLGELVLRVETALCAAVTIAKTICANQS